jgi:serine/threonine protein kinase
MPSEQVSLGETFGKYELLALLAVGGTAEVFLARSTGEAGFQKVLVVKRLLEALAENKEFVDMFLDEARLGARLDHSNIVQTIDLGEVDGRYFIALEYLAGLSLAQFARKGVERLPDGLPNDLMLGILAQACQGLHFAHEAKLSDGTELKIVHRDVTPQNLIVTYEGLVKVVDFGIAHAAVRESKTKTGMIKGKFAYMSPEQCLGKNIDRRTDIFALGIIGWEMLTGARLFKRDSTYKTYQAIISGEPIPLPSARNPRIDPELDSIIMRALAYEAAYRYDTAEAFGEALTDYLHRRGLRASRNEVGIFYETNFQEELKDHQQTLQALLSGEEAAINHVSGAWDTDDAPDPLGFDESYSGQEVVGVPTKIDAPRHAAAVAVARAAEPDAAEFTDPTIRRPPDLGSSGQEVVPFEFSTPTTRPSERRSRIDPMELEDATLPRVPRADGQRTPSPPVRALAGYESPDERAPTRLWVYPFVFVMAASAGAGILLLLRWLQVN